MKSKNFKDYLEKRLNKNEIAEIEQLAEIEFESINLRTKQVFQSFPPIDNEQSPQGFRRESSDQTV